MKDIISNCTYVNKMSFSDHLVTFKFEDFSSLHLTRIFSDNFIISWDFLWIDQKRGVLPVSIGSVGGWNWFVQVHVREFHHDFQANGWKPIKKSSHIESVETGETDLFWSIHKNSQKIIKLPEKILVKWRIEKPSILKETRWSERDILFT